MLTPALHKVDEQLIHPFDEHDELLHPRIVDVYVGKALKQKFNENMSF